MYIWHKIKCLFGFNNYELLGSYYDTGSTFIAYTDFENKHIYLKSVYRCNNCNNLYTFLIHDYVFYGDDYNYHAKLSDIRNRFMTKDDLFLNLLEKGYIK